MKTILIISADIPVTKLLSAALRSSNYEPVVASDNESGSTAAAVKPDLVLLDIDPSNSQDILKHLKFWFNNPVIVLSNSNQEQNVIQALDQGAIDYVVKPFRIPELLARVRLALRLKKKPHNAIIQYGKLSIDFANKLVKLNNQFVKLSPTEYSLLALLARYEGRVLTNTFLTEKIWGQDHPDALKDLRVYIARLRKKIEVTSDASVHIHTEIGIGYKFISTNDTSA